MPVYCRIAVDFFGRNHQLGVWGRSVLHKRHYAQTYNFNTHEKHG